MSLECCILIFWRFQNLIAVVSAISLNALNISAFGNKKPEFHRIVHYWLNLILQTFILFKPTYVVIFCSFIVCQSNHIQGGFPSAISGIRLQRKVPLRWLLDIARRTHDRYIHGRCYSVKCLISQSKNMFTL